MRSSDIGFTIKLNKARHDKVFQEFLAKCFGQRFLVQEGTVGVVCYEWRGVVYVAEELPNLPPSPHRIRPFKPDL